MPMDRWLIVFTALGGGGAVAAGAYASHGLSGQLQLQDWMRLGAEYQMVHSLAVLATVAMAERMSWLARSTARLAGWLLLTGSLLFSGTLYAQALSIPLPVPMTAPVGGVAMIAGWLVLAISALLPGGTDRGGR